MRIEEEMKGVLRLDGEIDLQLIIEAIKEPGIKTGGDEIVVEILPVLDVGAFVSVETDALDVSGNVMARKEPDQMWGEARFFSVLVGRGIADGELHVFSFNRFIETFTFKVCAPEPLKVPRSGEASLKSRP